MPGPRIRLRGMGVPPAMLAETPRLLEIHDRLCREFGCPIHYFHALSPLDELVSSLLSHRTRNADSARAFRNLRERFPGWEAVRDADTAAVQDAISPCTWPEAKAPALQRTLRALTDETRRLVEIARGLKPDILLESSGGITLENVRAYAEAGVDLISVGALTHSARAVDISFKILPA